MQVPTIGRIVIYRSRTGRYDVPAVITATAETLDPQGVALYHETDGAKGVPPLLTFEHVHLTVLTPGIPGFRAEGLAGEGDSPLEVRDQSERPVPAKGYGENAGGSYQEWNVPLDGSEGSPIAVVGTPNAGTWRWPEIRRAPEVRGQVDAAVLETEVQARTIRTLYDLGYELAAVTEAVAWNDLGRLIRTEAENEAKVAAEPTPPAEPGLEQARQTQPEGA